MFTLNTNLIKKLKANGIGFRYIGGIYDPMTIIVTCKNLDICRVDMNRSSHEPYTYNVYWFPSVVKNASYLKRKYSMSQELIDDIHRAIIFEGEDKMNNKMYKVSDVRARSSCMELDELYELFQMSNKKTSIKDVIFNNPATIVLWTDGTKTVVKAENEEFDPEKGLAMAIAKKTLGNNYEYYDVFKKYIGRYEKKQKKGGK